MSIIGYLAIGLFVLIAAIIGGGIIFLTLTEGKPNGSDNSNEGSSSGSSASGDDDGEDDCGRQAYADSCGKGKGYYN